MKKKRTAFFFLSLFLLVMAFSTVCGAAGWKTKNGKTKYYTSAKRYVKDQWKKIGKKWYYFDKKGNLKTGRFKVGEKYYYVTRSKGRAVKKKVGNYYYGADGAMVTGCWKKCGKYYFYFGDNGKMKTGRFQLGEDFYYCRKKTGRVEKARVGDYYYNAKGVMVTDQWAGKYYYGADGKAVYGKFTIDGKTYCCTRKNGKVTYKWYQGNFYDEDGVMATSTWIGSGSNKAYVDENGVITEGNRNPKDPPTEKEIRLLAALVYLEAGNQSYRGKLAVASVVINRLNSKRFPNTLKGVIYQEGQFGPAMTGLLDSLYKSKKSIQKACVKAAKEVLNEGSKFKGYYHFNGAWGRLKIGDHYFS